MTVGEYLRLRRTAAGVELADLALDAELIEADELTPAAYELNVYANAGVSFDYQIARDLIAGNEVQACRVCGCSNWDACDPPCHWVEPDLCSACAARQVGETTE